jgi:serine/threonine-protein kinase
VLYEMLTGRLAFGGETLSDSIARVLERDVDMDALPANTPAAIRELLRRCFEKDLKRRLRDIGDAVLVIDDVLAARGWSSSGVEAPAAAVGRRVDRRTLVFAAAGFAVLASAAAIGAAIARISSVAPRSAALPSVRMSVVAPDDLRISQAQISPDGRAIAVLASAAASAGQAAPQAAVYVRRLDSFDVARLAGTDGAMSFNSSPDGRSIAFVAPSRPGTRRSFGWR